jgi:hypothetical protein
MTALVDWKVTVRVENSVQLLLTNGLPGIRLPAMAKAAGGSLSLEIQLWGASSSSGLYPAVNGPASGRRPHGGGQVERSDRR